MTTTTGAEPTIIGVVNTKGGVGKTTTAIYLATAYAQAGHPVTVLDLDKQGSASSWADRAADDGNPLPFDVELANVARLPRIVSALTTRGHVVILDTPPGDPGIIDATVNVARFVVVPVQASPIEVERVWPTLQLLEHVPHGVLVTSARLGTRNLEQVREVLAGQGVGVFSTVIPLRESVRDSFGDRVERLEGYAHVMREMGGL